MSILKVSNLKKQYLSHWTYQVKGNGLKDVSFQVNKGDCFALLGGNGAGKTTTIKCILGLITPTSGSINYEIGDIISFKKDLGFLPEQPYFYQHLSVLETLDLYAGLFGMRGKALLDARSRVIETVGLNKFLEKKVKTLSKGQQQRVGIAQSLINDPNFLILDEPFSGLDPLSRFDMKKIFRDLNKSGKTIIISSHVLADIEELCSRAIILKDGEVRREIKMQDLHQAGANEVIYQIMINGKKLNDVKGILENYHLHGENFEEVAEGILSMELKGQENSANALHMLIHGGCEIVEYRKKHRSLEDVFLEVNKE